MAGLWLCLFRYGCIANQEPGTVRYGRKLPTLCNFRGPKVSADKSEEKNSSNLYWLLVQGLRVGCLNKIQDLMNPGFSGSRPHPQKFSRRSWGATVQKKKEKQIRLLRNIFWSFRAYKIWKMISWLQTFSLLLPRSPSITKDWIFGHSQHRRYFKVSRTGGCQCQSVEDSNLVKSMLFEERWQFLG